MTDKVVNYTDEQVATLVEAYKAVEGYEAEQGVVEVYAAEFGKTKGSIVAKLSSVGVYNPKAKAAKAKVVAKKDAIVDLIAAQVGVDAESFDSLAKANKTVLAKLYGVIGALKARVTELEDPQV